MSDMITPQWQIVSTTPNGVVVFIVEAYDMQTAILIVKSIKGFYTMSNKEGEIQKPEEHVIFDEHVPTEHIPEEEDRLKKLFGE